MLFGKLFIVTALLMQFTTVHAQTFSLDSDSSITYRIRNDCIESISDMSGPQMKEACDAQGMGCCTQEAGTSGFPCGWSPKPVKMCRDACQGENVCRYWNNPPTISIGPGSCHGDQACTIGSSDVGANACHGRLACSQAENTVVGDGSCTNFEACTRSKNSVIGKNSCTDFQGCRYFDGTTVGNGSCTLRGSENCQSFMGTAGDCVATCKGDDVCLNEGIFDHSTGTCTKYKVEDDCIVTIDDMSGPQMKEACDARGMGCCTQEAGTDGFPCGWAPKPVKMCRDACQGENVCRYWNNPPSISIGPSSCHGLQACTIGASDVGANACHGRLACSQAENTVVGDASCTEFEACTRSKNSVIGKNSCTAKQACRYFDGTTVGNGSCTLSGSLSCQSFMGTAGDCVATCKGDDVCPSEATFDHDTGTCSGFPTSAPTSTPTSLPTSNPTGNPTSGPTSAPTARPTTEPTVAPTATPNQTPTSAPTGAPNGSPTSAPTEGPSRPPSVGMEGDPHVKTWSGNTFDFQGECDLVLVHAVNFDGEGRDLILQARTTIRYSYSYISSAALQIGDDVLEVSSWGDYAVNGVDTPYLGAHHAGKLANTYTIHHTNPEPKKHTFEVVLGPNESITLRTFKDLVAVSINAGADSAKYFDRSVGIMGSYNGILLARDGETVMDDMDKFGAEWQVTDEEPMLFRTARAPQYPQRCIMPTTKTSTKRRRLGESIARQAAEAACAHVSGAKFENCVFDVMAINDADIAGSYQ